MKASNRDNGVLSIEALIVEDIVTITFNVKGSMQALTMKVKRLCSKHLIEDLREDGAEDKYRTTQCQFEEGT